jgi:hypothetical protein
VQLLKIGRSSASVGEHHEGDVGDTSKRVEVGVSTKAIGIAKVDDSGVYDEVKKDASA